VPKFLILWLAILLAMPHAVADQATSGAGLAGAKSDVGQRAAEVGAGTRRDGDRALRASLRVAAQALRRSSTSGASPSALHALASPPLGWGERLEAARLAVADWISRAAAADSGNLAYFPTAPPYTS
jgi:hypothetical protein